MKKTSIFLALFIAGSLVAESLTLAWDHNPRAENVDIYKVYHATNLAGPWVVIGSTTNNRIQMDLSDGDHSFYVTASRQALESDPSKIVTHQPFSNRPPRRTKGKKSNRFNVGF